MFEGKVRIFPVLKVHSSSVAPGRRTFGVLLLSEIRSNFVGIGIRQRGLSCFLVVSVVCRVLHDVSCFVFHRGVSWFFGFRSLSWFHVVRGFRKYSMIL